MVRCIAISEVRCFVPSMRLPSMSQTIRSSAVIMPLQTAVGVHSTRSSSRRTLILPSFDAIQPFWNTNEPTLTMSCRNSASDFDIRDMIVAIGERPRAAPLQCDRLRSVVQGEIDTVADGRMAVQPEDDE